MHSMRVARCPHCRVALLVVPPQRRDRTVCLRKGMSAIKQMAEAVNLHMRLCFRDRSVRNSVKNS